MSSLNLKQLIHELDMKENQIKNKEKILLDRSIHQLDQINCYENESIDELEKCKDIKKFTFDGQIHLAKIVRCYDGDTCYCVFKYNNEYQLFTIRMYGYDSAEIKVGPNITDDQRIILKDKGLSDKHRLEELILNKCVYVFCKDFDKYGRILANIKISLDDDMTINDRMINEGHGYPYFGGTKQQNN